MLVALGEEQWLAREELGDKGQNPNYGSLKIIPLCQTSLFALLICVNQQSKIY